MSTRTEINLTTILTHCEQAVVSIQRARQAGQEHSGLTAFVNGHLRGMQNQPNLEAILGAADFARYQALQSNFQALQAANKASAVSQRALPPVAASQPLPASAASASQLSVAEVRAKLKPLAERLYALSKRMNNPAENLTKLNVDVVEFARQVGQLVEKVKYLPERNGARLLVDALNGRTQALVSSCAIRDNFNVFLARYPNLTLQEQQEGVSRFTELMRDKAKSCLSFEQLFKPAPARPVVASRATVQQPSRAPRVIAPKVTEGTINQYRIGDANLDQNKYTNPCTPTAAQFLQTVLPAPAAQIHAGTIDTVVREGKRIYVKAVPNGRDLTHIAEFSDHYFPAIQKTQTYTLPNRQTAQFNALLQHLEKMAAQSSKPVGCVITAAPGSYSVAVVPDSRTGKNKILFFDSHGWVEGNLPGTAYIAECADAGQAAAFLERRTALAANSGRDKQVSCTVFVPRIRT